MRMIQLINLVVLTNLLLFANQVATRICTIEQFLCPNLAKCIPYRFFCDRDNDCEDRSDEDFCAEETKHDHFADLGLEFVNDVFKCIKPGYQYTGDQRLCEDVDECLSNPCPNLCLNTEGSYKCACDTGYKLENVTNECKDIDECSSNPCSDFCLNTAGSFKCLCPVGYQVQNTTTCVDIDECLSNPCSQQCTNAPGQFTCSCSKGYLLGDDQLTCKDIDECINSTTNKCEQVCINNIGSFSCSCNKGYFLESDEYQCEDVNECQELPRVCSQTCHNYEGSFNCSCLAGFIPWKNGTSCIIKEGNIKLAYSSQDNSLMIRTISLENRFNITKSRSGIIKNVFYEAEKDAILLLEARPVGGAIIRTFLGNLSNTAIVTIHEGNPEAMAIDRANNKFYVLDSARSAILVYDWITSQHTVLRNLTVDLPTSIALDTVHGFLYYSNVGRFGLGIYRASMSGGSSLPIVKTDILHPQALDMDTTSNVLYWVDSALNKVEMIDINTLSRKVLATASNGESFKGWSDLMVFEDDLYFSRQNVIFSTNKRTFDEIIIRESSTENITNVFVSGSFGSSFFGEGPCKNHSCHQMCLGAPNKTHTCVCYEGFDLTHNNTCVAKTNSTDPRLSLANSNAYENGVNNNDGKLNEVNSESKEVLDIKELKRTTELNLIRALVEKTETIITRLDDFQKERDPK